MKTFKASLQIMKRHKAQILIYFIIFAVIFIIVASFFAETSDFSESKPKFTVINRDEETPLTEGLRTYLSLHGTETTLEDDRQTLQDALFYGATEYILIIPEGFQASLTSAEPLEIETAAVPNTAAGYYMASLANRYWSLTADRLSAADNADMTVLTEEILHTLSRETAVDTVRFSESQPVHETYSAYNRVQSYIILVLILLCVSSVTMTFRKPELRMRNLCAPVTARSRNLGQFLYCGIVSLFVWAIISIMGLVLSASHLAGTDIRLIGLLLLNSFIFTLTALSVSMLSSFFVTSGSSQNACANFLSLALCFLGGTFVPLELLSDSLLTVSRFTPVYWYSSASDAICSMTAINSHSLAPVWQAMSIELLFAAALLCLALAVGKHKNRRENAFGSTRTELDM